MWKTTMCCLVITIAVAFGLAASIVVIQGDVESADGVRIAYTTAGRGAETLIFIHGGFADSSYWNHQVGSLSDRFQVVAVDLAGHGASGTDREVWSLEAFGEDVRAVADDLGLRRIVVIGNSLGGPVALEAARLMPKRVVGVIGIDTLHDGTEVRNAEQMDAYIQAWKTDYIGTCTAMVKMLFHQDADPDLVKEVREQMCDGEERVTERILEGFRDYDLGKAMRAVKVPVRSLNGDLYPTNVKGNKQLADYDAVVMEHTGHYPMLEKPEEFDRLLLEMLEEIGVAGAKRNP
jgi:pimeloyl-ACP methyl ester carboxylesterase